VSEQQAGPADPISTADEGAITLCEWYRKLRAGGMPIVASVAYIVVFQRVNSEDPPAS
jgi:hypothetical protein